MQLAITNQLIVIRELARVAELLHGGTEVLLVQEFMTREEPLEERIMCRTREPVVENVVNGVVADQMMGHAVNLNRDCLLDQATGLEVIRIHQ